MAVGHAEVDHEQRLDALRKANEIRTRRAAEKRALKTCGPISGRRRAAELLTEVPRYWAGATVEQVLLAVPGVGRVKCQRVLARLKLAPNKRLGQLSGTTRSRLIEEIAR